MHRTIVLILAALLGISIDVASYYLAVFIGLFFAVPPFWVGFVAGITTFVVMCLMVFCWLVLSGTSGIL